MTRPRQDTRETIIDMAGRLFYRLGIRDVSMDMIAAKADLTKKTLYYHFRSKDALIAATLERRAAPNLAAFRKTFATAPGTLAAKTAALFAALETSTANPRWRGCGFLRTAAELVDSPGHPAMAVAAAHKRAVEDWLAQEYAAAGEAPARQLALQVRLLLDGCFAAGLLERNAGLTSAAGAAAALLVEAALPAPAPATAAE